MALTNIKQRVRNEKGKGIAVEEESEAALPFSQFDLETASFFLAVKPRFAPRLVVYISFCGPSGSDSAPIFAQIPYSMQISIYFPPRLIWLCIHA